MNTMLGAPLAVWGFGCLMIAAAYWSFWPQPNAGRLTPRTPFTHFILRYGHALVWLLLAAGCFLAGFGLTALGIILAAAAVPLYLLFLVMLLRDRSQDEADRAARKAAQGRPAAPGQPANTPD